jgi:hypothetical protein
LYLTDRFGDQVRAFAIGAGPSFTQIAAIRTGANDLDRTNPRDLALSADAPSYTWRTRSATRSLSST